MKKVIVINAKIAQFGEDFSTLCVLDAQQGIEEYSKTLAKQVTNFCTDNDVEITEKEALMIAETLCWSDYAETPRCELLFTAATYEIL